MWSQKIFNNFNFDITLPHTTYMWDDGTTNPTNKINSKGTHWVVATNVCGTENGIGKIIQSAESADHKTGKTWSECESAVWSEGRRKFFGGDVEWNLNHMHTRHTASKRF